MKESFLQQKERIAGRGFGGAIRRPAKVGEARTYRIADYAGHGGTTFKPVVVEVVVSAACPAPGCGLARGEGEPMTIKVHGGGDTPYVITRHRNPCGHVDLHVDLLAEAAGYAREQAS